MVRNVKGFTMVELMIVISIIGILAVTLIPAFSGMQERAKDTGIVNQVEGASLALEGWKIDTSLLFPLPGLAAASTPSNQLVAPTSNPNLLSTYASTSYFSSLKKEKVCQGGSSLDSSLSGVTIAGATCNVVANNFSYGYTSASRNGVSSDTYLIWARVNTPSKGTLNSSIVGISSAANLNVGTWTGSSVSTPGTSATPTNGKGYYAIYGGNK